MDISCRRCPDVRGCGTYLSRKSAVNRIRYGQPAFVTRAWQPLARRLHGVAPRAFERYGSSSVSGGLQRKYFRHYGFRPTGDRHHLVNVVSATSVRATLPSSVRSNRHSGRVLRAKRDAHGGCARYSRAVSSRWVGASARVRVGACNINERHLREGEHKAFTACLQSY